MAICYVIQGCHAEGQTITEALDNVEDVARILLELRVEDGLPLPEGLLQLAPDTVLHGEVHGGKDIPKETLAAILRDLGLSKEDLDKV